MVQAGDGLGELVDLAEAIGLVRDGQLKSDWFSDPGAKVGAMLRNQDQREALLRALETLLGGETPPFVDEDGRTWAPVVARGGVSLHVVVEAASAATVIGLGARLETTVPESRTDIFVPLMCIPATGPATAVPDTDDGRVRVRSEITLDGSAPAPDKPHLRGLGFGIDVAANGTTPKLSAHLRGLRLTGQDAPQDVNLDGGAGLALGDDALRLVLGLVERSVAGASGPLVELLALVGLTSDPALPSLKVADVLKRGMAAWREWLETLLANPAAVSAWLNHAAALAGHGATVTSSLSPDAPRVITWSVVPGVPLSFTARVRRTPAGAFEVELGASVRATNPGPPPGGIELDAVLMRITLGAAPNVRAVPRLDLVARLGALSGTPLVDVTSPRVVKVQALRAGLALGPTRQPMLVLAAHGVRIDQRAFPVLDLTNVQTLVDLGGTAVNDVAAKLLSRLGPAEQAVRVIVGLAPPPGRSSWPPTLTPVTDLLADPVKATLAYHARVLRSVADTTGAAPYVELVRTFGMLLAVPGQTGQVTGAGSDADPWRVAIAAGLELTVVADAAVTLGLALRRSVAELGGGCPTVGFEARADLVRAKLDGTGGQVLPAASAQLLIGARGGADVRMGFERGLLVAQRLGLALRWRAGAPLEVRLEAPGLGVEIDGERAPFPLPRLQPDGRLAGDVPWRAIELLTAHVLRQTGPPAAGRIVDLLGWLPHAGGASRGRRTPLQSLLADPVRALRDVALELDVDELAGWLSLLFTGPTAAGVEAGTTTGRGDPSAPYWIPIAPGGSDAARAASLLLWASTGRELPAERFRPGGPAAWLTADPASATPPPPGELAAAVGVAALFGRTAEEVFEARPALAAGFAELTARWADGDGLVPRGSAVLPGATVHDLQDVPHLDLPAALDLETVTGVTPGPAVIYATGPLGLGGWPGVAADHVIDLSAAGLPPEGFDVTPVFQRDGPWAVLLPRREDAGTGAPDGAAGQVARLARVVDAAVAHAGVGRPVMVVAHGAAGHAAARVAATRPGITHLVTVGTPHAAISLDVLERQPGAGALQLLAALLPEPDPERPEHLAVTLGRGLLAPLLAAYRVSAPQVDLAPVGAPPVIPAGVAVHCVRGVVAPTSVSKALSGLLVRGLQEAYEADADPSADEEGTAGVGAGLALRLAPPVAAEDLRVRTELSLLVPGLAPAGDPAAMRGIRARIDVDRDGGWLAGGPDPARPPGVPRTPSLRRATFELDLPAGGGALARARIVLHEAEALGIRRRRWELTGDGDPMPPEARVLLGRFAAALGPLPASGPVRQLVDVLVALGLTEPGTSEATGAPVSLSVDGVRRLLVDPGGLARDAPAVPLAEALARLVGAPAPAPATPARWVAEVDGLRITADVAAPHVHVETIGDGLALVTGLRLRGWVDLAGDGSLTGAGSLAAFGGVAVLDAESAPPRVGLRLLDVGAALPSEVALHPVPDAAGLARLLVAVVPAEVLAAGVAFLRGLPPAGVAAAVDPALRALDLLDAGDRVRVPIALLSDPARALTRPAPSGNRVLALIDALGPPLGVKGPTPSAWSLPYGLTLSAAGAGNRTRISLLLAEPPAGATLRISGSASLLVGSGMPAVPEVDVRIGVPAVVVSGPEESLTAAPPPESAIPGDTQPPAGAVAVKVGAGTFSVRLLVPSLGIDAVIVPPERGIAGALAAGIVHALPFVLDAVTDLPQGTPGGTIGAALAQLGDALALRTTGRFDAAKLEQFAADPARGLATRLSANLTAGLDALRALVNSALPPALLTLTRSGSELVLTRTGQSWLSLKLAVPSTTGARVTGTLTGLRPFAGATVGADITLDATGLSRAGLQFAVDPAAGLELGPLWLAPRAEVAAGPAVPGGARVAAGLAVDATTAVMGVLRLGPPRTFALEATGASLPDALTALLLPLAVDLALSTAEMQALLDRQVLGTRKLRALLEGSLLKGGELDRQALTPAQVFPRLLKLGAAVAGANPSLHLDPLSIGAAQKDGVYGLSVTLPPGNRFDLGGEDVTVQAEVDASWIGDQGTPGLAVYLLDLKAAPKPAFGLGIRGLGLRLGRRTGPLLDAFVTTDSVAVHGLLEASTGGVTAAGGQLELTGLRLPVGGAKSPNSDRVASGVLRDSASGSEPLAPRFSPAFAVQRRADKVLRFDLRAGEGDGPWFLPIQRGFGPVYVEQVGFGVSKSPDKLKLTGARVLVDGRVSLLGLTVEVDDLGLGANWPAGAGDATAWSVSLAGLGVSAQTGGLSIAGGLRRMPGGPPDYVGMFSLRFGFYALTAYGGYGVLTDQQGEYTSLFVVGALNAPIGGPPAFFLTGIGGGVGINRRLEMPDEIADLPDYPLVKAFKANVPPTPLDTLNELRAKFPPQRGAFWFAAGVSFTSFALVDCIAVLAVEVAEGLAITLMGLARAALPSTALTLAQLELALLVRFSTRDGVLWMQGQLTDNSYLLSKDVRLTGGFAYVSWFKGDKAGEFVLTLGGYHPSFHRDGYPVVPRLGFVWAIGKALVIKGESYFALTSEAIMLGVRFEARLTLGPLWAYLRLGADGIVFFDPFRYEVSAFAELGAGITIDIDLGWFGHIRITIGFHLHADVVLIGPRFHGTATIDIGVTSATIAFGDDDAPEPLPLPWDVFSEKYLRAGGASVLTAVPGRGQVTPSPGGTDRPQTGAADDPYLVKPEFDLMVTTTMPYAQMRFGDSAPVGAVTDPLAIGPMHIASVKPLLSFKLFRRNVAGDQMSSLSRTWITSQVPKGIWGPQGDDRPVPKGETLTSSTGMLLTSIIVPGQGLPPIKYGQVEIGPRHRLPFVYETAPHALEPGDRAMAHRAVDRRDGTDWLATARRRLTKGPLAAGLSPLASATFAAARSAPPQLLPLTHGVSAAPEAHVEVPLESSEPAPAPADTRPETPSVAALITLGQRGGQAAELRPGPGLAPAGERRLRALRSAVAADGFEVVPGQVVLLQMPNAARDVGEARPALRIEGGPTRVVAVDTVGSVVIDVTLAGGAVSLPPKTARIAVVGGGGPLDGAPGWYAGSALVQLGARSLLAPGCTVTSSTVSTRRGIVRVNAAVVTAAEAVGGRSLVTTRLPSGISSVAVMLDGEDGTGGDQLLELGIAQATTSGAPLRIADEASTTSVYTVAPEPGVAAVEVTVASGRDVDLCGVLGSDESAPALAERLRTDSFPGLLGALVPSPRRGAHVSWVAAPETEIAR
jgi:large repetitive protein